MTGDTCPFSHPRGLARVSVLLLHWGPHEYELVVAAGGERAGVVQVESCGLPIIPLPSGLRLCSSPCYLIPVVPTRPPCRFVREMKDDKATKYQEYTRICKSARHPSNLGVRALGGSMFLPYTWFKF